MSPSLFFLSRIPPPPTTTLFPYTTLFRSGFSDQSVSLSLGGDELFAGTLDAESTHLLEEGEPIIVQNVPAAPGAMVDMSLAVSGAGSQVEPVPVVDGTLPAYAKVLEEHAAALSQ